MAQEVPSCPACNSSLVVFSKKKERYICEDCGHEFVIQEKIVPRRIFLSYGHDEFAPLAERMRADLLKRGHEVWFDADRLKGGTDWEISIERGLAWVTEMQNGILILLMTPHSVRRPDGFCLNEIARAIMRRVEIVPVMVVQTEPPLSICRIQYLDMQECFPLGQNESVFERQFGLLSKAVEEGQHDTDGIQIHLQALLDPPDFREELSRHLRHFTGRQWMLDDLRAWFYAPDYQRIYWITGKPGVGKSALAAWITSQCREVGAYHLCKYGDTSKGDPRRVIMSVVYQLGTQLPEYKRRLSEMPLRKILDDTPDAQTLFDRLLVQPLSYHFPAPDHPVVILIDALDEADVGGKNRLSEFLSTEFVRTPPWLLLVVTSRPEPDIRTLFQNITPHDIATDDGNNRTDLHTYLATRLQGIGSDRHTVETACDVILARSEGIILYCELLCREILDPVSPLDLSNPGKFPQGLGALLGKWFGRQFQDMERYQKDIRPLLRIILAAYEPVPFEILSGASGRSREELNDDMQKMGALFLEVRGGIQPFHRSVAEWLTNREKAGKYYVDEGEGHRALAAYGWRQYELRKCGMGDFLLRHLPMHLIEAGEKERAVAFLSDLDVFAILFGVDKYAMAKIWMRLGEGETGLGGDVYRRALKKLKDSLPVPDGHYCSHADDVGTFCDVIGAYDSALEIFEEVLTVRGTNEQGDAPLLAHAMIKVASTLVKVGKYRDAEAYYRRVLEMRKRTIGGDHLDTALSLNDLAYTLDIEGRYDEAEPLYRRSLEIQERILGSDHLNVALLKNNYAGLFFSQGRYLEAESLCRSSLSIRQSLLGKEHPDVATSLNNLAQVCHNQGKYEEAERLYRQSLVSREKCLGGEHPDVATSLNNLASLFRDVGRYGDAEPLYIRSAAIWRKVFGGQHEYVGRSLNNLGELYCLQGKYQEAESSCRQAIEIGERTLGGEHDALARFLSNLADVYVLERRYSEALPLYRRTLEIQMKKLVLDHPETLMTTKALAETLANLSMNEEAIPLFEQWLSRQRGDGVEVDIVRSKIQELKSHT